MKGKKYNRENVFSNPAIQGRIVTLFFGLAAILIATSWTMSWRVLSRFSENVMALSSSDIYQRDVMLLLKQQQAVLMMQFFIYSVLSFVLMGLGTVLLSHRIGGPLHHLTTYCRGVARGNVKPQEIHFRKKDIPQELAIAFNNFQRYHGILAGAPNSPPKSKPD